jgi:succinylglutamate desuccinylase
MIALMFSPVAVTCGEPKKLRKFRKRLAKERREDLERMAEKIKDIGQDELRRSKELLREHQEYFQRSEEKKKEKSIDFFEK